MKRRIIHKLKMTEISGVDRPCQEGALVTIMKRDDTPDPVDVANLETMVTDLEAQIADLTKKVPRQKEFAMDFERHVAELRKEGCSGTEALAKARKEAPQAFAAYRNENVAKSDDSDYDALVDAEMHKGCPTRAIAAQRILQMHRKQIREVVTLG